MVADLPIPALATSIRTNGVFCAALIFIVLQSLSGSAIAQSASKITIHSDTRSIYLGDSVILDIESTGLIDPLDVTQLKQSAGFLRETTGTRIAVIEGKVVEIAIRRMEFIPDKEGTQIYGPIAGNANHGDVLSNSISVQINPALNANWQPDENDLDGEIVFSNNQPIAGEQIIADIKLRHKFQIANEKFSLPKFTDFDVLAVYEQRRTVETTPIVETINSTSSSDDMNTSDELPAQDNWRQVAWRLLLHPKKSGTVKVAPLTWSGTMIKSRSQRGDFNKTIFPAALQVQPIPAERPEWWLPATTLDVSDSWSKDVRTLSAGDEIIRTITLKANHILSKQIPTIEPYPTRALTSTLIRSTRDHTLNGDHTTATGVFEFRMVAQSPIPVFLDTVRVPWWNTATNTHEEAIIPARRINVGLPDRKDLLADLAINHSRVSQWILTLRSYARWQPILITLGTLTALVLVFPFLRNGYRYDRFEREQRAAVKRLEHLRKQRNWSGLYNELDRIKNADMLNTNSANYQRLISKLQQILFKGNEQTIKEMQNTRIELEFKPYTGTIKKRVVADL